MEQSYQNTNQKPRVVLLYRASSKQQVDSENDIPLQRNILKPWAQEQGWEFVCEKVEAAVSGFKVHAADRDKIQEIKRMAERREFDILGIYMSDRLGRIAEETPLIVSYLNARQIKVISYCEGEISSNSHSEKLMTYIRYWQAEGESLKTSARVCDAVLENVNKGRWRGGLPPYGYRNVSRGTLNYKGKPIKDVEIDPETAEHVKTIFRLYTEEHYGTRLIARYLNDHDVLTPKNTRWSSSLICKLLRCKTYIGIYQLHTLTKNKPLVESPLMPHLVIVDDKTWYKAQEMMIASNRNPDRVKPTRNGKLLLTGMLYCGQCGNKISSFYSYPSSQKNLPPSQRKKQFYYQCPKMKKPSSDIAPCRPSMWNVKQLDDAVISYAKSYIASVDREKLLANNGNETQIRHDECAKRLSKIQAELTKKQKEISKLSDEIVRALMGESVFSSVDINAMLTTRKTELSDLQTKHADIKAELDQLDMLLTTRQELAENLDTWESRFDAASTTDKKAMLLNIIDRIEITYDTIKIKYRIEFNSVSTIGFTIDTSHSSLDSRPIAPNDQLATTTAKNAQFMLNSPQNPALPPISHTFDTVNRCPSAQRATTN